MRREVQSDSAVQVAVKPYILQVQSNCTYCTVLCDFGIKLGPTLKIFETFLAPLDPPDF